MTRTKFVIIAAAVGAGALRVSAQQPALGSTVRLKDTSGIIRTAPKLLPGTRPNILATIEGQAVDSTGGALSNTLLRLRDARIGRVIESQLTDKDGKFSFKDLDPGSYIVEMMASDQTVLTASQLINVNAGEAVSTIVKLPFRLSKLAGVLGNTTPAAAAAMLAMAATSGVLARTVSGQPVTPGK